MKTVLIVDDDKDLRYMLRYLIETTSNFEVVGEAATGEEAIEKAGLLHPDLIIMDVQMPVMDGIEATKQITQMWPRTQILGLTAFGEYPETMLGAGAKRCLLKTDSYTRLTQVMTQMRDESETGEVWY